MLDKRCDDEKHEFTPKDSEFVIWDGIKLVPTLRSFPKFKMSLEFVKKLRNGSIILCDKGVRCQLELCTYAHNKEELKNFNNLLSSYRRGEFLVLMYDV